MKTELQLISDQFKHLTHSRDLVQHVQMMARQLGLGHDNLSAAATSAIPRHIRDALDGSSAAVQAARLVDLGLYEVARSSSSLYRDAVQRSAVQVLGGELTLLAASQHSAISSISSYAAQHLNSVSEQHALVESLRRQAFGGLSVADFVSQAEAAGPALRAMEDAKRALDRLLPTFHNIDFSQFEASDNDVQETNQVAESIARATAGQHSLQESVGQIILVILAQKPAVQVSLWLIFSKILDWLISGAIGAAMGHYAPAVLGESPQAANKAVQESARAAVGATQLLEEYRYISAQLLIVRQNPRARSPEIGRLAFGKAVKLLKKEKDFSLVVWTDGASDTVIQGWVFSRHLAKFN